MYALLPLPYDFLGIGNSAIKYVWNLDSNQQLG